MSLQSLIQQHRAALLARERAASAEMARSYDLIWQRIQARLDELLTKMQQAQDAGKDIKVSWLYEQSRLGSLQTQVEQEIAQYARYAGGITRNLGTQAVMTGVQDANALLRGALPGINISFNSVPHGALIDLVGSFQPGSPVADLFNSFGADAAQAVKTALISGVGIGKNPRIIARDIESALDVTRQRAQVIARQSVLSAYRSANMETYRANSDVVNGWYWSAALGPRTCAVCISLNGTFHPLSEEFYSHVNCRCCPAPATKSYASLGYSGIAEPDIGLVNGEDWFAKQPANVQQAIIGSKAGYEAYQRGDVNLSDFAGVKHNAQYGAYRYQKSVKEALK